MTRFKSIAGAERRIRQLSNQAVERDRLLEQYARDRVLLAKLAAKGPAFYNPIDAWEAEKVRDSILDRIGLKPDGSPKVRQP